MRTDLLRGQLDALLLAVLAEGPRHGYAIVEELRGRTGGELELAEGTLYPALHRLERDGLLESRWSTDAPRRPRGFPPAPPRGAPPAGPRPQGGGLLPGPGGGPGPGRVPPPPTSRG